MPENPKDLVLLDRFFTEMEAEIVRGLLRDGGIESILSSRWDGFGGGMTSMNAGFGVLVRREDLVRSLRLVRAAREGDEGKGGSPPDPTSP